MGTGFRLVMAVGLLAFVFVCFGCAAALIGGGAAGGYKAGTDERTVRQMADDAGLASTVKSELAKDSLMTAYDIDVDVLEGHVTLTGVVKTQAIADRAVGIALSVRGVKGVRNNLQIGEETFAGSVNDSWVASKIKSKLVAEPGIRSLNIDVDVYRGVVTLTGIVSEPGQKTRALSIAGETQGVVSVVDNLTVKYP